MYDARFMRHEKLLLSDEIGYTLERYALYEARASRSRLSTTEVVATDNTQTEISKRPRGNRRLMDRNPCLDSPRRIGVLRAYPHSEKSDCIPSRSMLRRETRGKIGMKGDGKCQ
ncbi:hypothetical protein PUN28_014144 [Cardiocondyla obscurior]|uniref:Uncharacterized protein n=1 Tax=Cardiocondyla obscurior TaxID=286306 RepID=A0AAW2F135_9HYME